MGPKEENSKEVFKEGKGISEKLHQFCALIPTTEEPGDHPVTQLICTGNTPILKCQQRHTEQTTRFVRVPKTLKELQYKFFTADSSLNQFD